LIAEWSELFVQGTTPIALSIRSAYDPGPYVTQHGLQFAKDGDIVNYEAGKYSRANTSSAKGSTPPTGH